MPRSVQILAQVLPDPDSAYPLVFKPYKLDISQFGEKKRSEIEFDIQNRSDEELKLEVISYNPNYIDVDIPATVAAGAVVQGHVKVKDDKLEESFEKSLTIQATGPKENEKPVRFTVPVKRAYRNVTEHVNSAMSPPKPKGSSGGGGK